MDLNIDNAKSYATEANLMKALEKLGFAAHRHLVVCNRAGRYTAIFPFSNIKGGYVALYASQGFVTLG
jgi:hypothetical protein